jgi:hypothetical protein
MANRAYISIWTRGYSEAVMLDQFEALLKVVPLSSQRPAFSSLLIRAISPSEAPLAEHDTRTLSASASEIVSWAREYQNADTAYEVEAYWDLWQWDSAAYRWQRNPERLVIVCNGPDYDEGFAGEAGHFLVDIGFEHHFTGHAGLLRPGPAGFDRPVDPVEAGFLTFMQEGKHLHEYYEKTQKNIQQLLQWVREMEKALPLDRYRLWSEGEVNLEARLDEILAVH